MYAQLVDTGVKAVQTAADMSAADQAFYDGVADLLFNRRPFSDYDSLVADWRTAAGDAIRTEFLQEINTK